MRGADAGCAGGCLLLALVVVGEGLRLGIGWGTDGPEPGFFLFYLGLTLALAAAAILIRLVRRPAAPPDRRPFLEARQWRPIAAVLLPAVGMVALTHLVGLYVAGGLYLGAYMRWIGRHSWPLTAVLTVVVPVVTFLVFEVWFLVPLPKGPLEALLGY